ncbi:serine/threonine/tyrosine-interacting-like protein 1 isoform X2 [Antedon mediterranea]|uniref:serine/threonine/tyrosine-interacting-like protein 1 isoform X2 n=1 Tax=Antedon mediterranea TaxID=105859 RepID=UPI003AF9C006
MGISISCRQGIDVVSVCCRTSTIKSSTQTQNSTNQDVTNSSLDKIPVGIMAEKTKPEDVPESETKSKFLKRLPKKSDGYLIPQRPPDIQSKDGFMNIHELYNAMNVGYSQPYIHDPYYMLILDTRSVKSYSNSHILTARKHTAIDTDFECHIDLGKLLQYTMVILYGEVGTSDDDDDVTQGLLSRIGAMCDVYILVEGFSKFKSTYPALCSSDIITSKESRKKISTYPSVVLAGCLFQGNKDHAENKTILKDVGITHIVNVTSEMKNLFQDDFVYLRIAVEDELSSNLRPRLSQAADFIADALRNGGRVMVHCIQGVSRSSTITLSFMMKYLGWPLKDARDYLKICRPIINPNRTFLLQLSHFEETCFGEKISDPDDVWMS